MSTNYLKEGSQCQLEVIKESSSRSFFKVKTSDGREFILKKFKFQEKEAVPDFLDCFVKTEEPLSIGQDISVLISRFYKEGKDYDFRVKEIKSGNEIHYDVEDDFGFQFKLFNVPILLTKGTTIKCKILKINGINVYLKYVGTSSRSYPLDFYDMKKWLDILNHPELEERFQEMLSTEPEFSETLQKYNDKDASWILEVLKVFSLHISDWLIKCQANPTLLKKITLRLQIARDLSLYILQESDYLKKCELGLRRTFQKRLANYIERFEEYLTGASYIIDNQYDKFMNDIVERLKESGYIYNPSRQISIMMTILKLQPKLIKDHMKGLFEALHNWEPSNWESEPFRQALVEQLQIYIEENYGKVNILPPNDSGAENKQISRMIVALAIQRILANEEDNIDMNLNRAIFYRYISYLLPKKVEDLLEKAIQSILGADAPNEYTWDDTETPPILFERSSHPFTNIAPESLLEKTYSSSKADIILHNDHIHIIAKGASPDSTAVPNGLVDWFNPVISLNDSLKIKLSQKTKDLNTYKQMWDQVIFSLMGNEEETPATIKKLPETGDRVKVIIDDYTILKTGKPEERLQFHCLIRDDLYYGDGWMPCDTLHMIGWLRDKDYPVNFDGSLRFAQSSDGSPLLFEATVDRFRDGSIGFKMNSQIEEYLSQICNTGQEFLAIVTHQDKTNNKWLCLTEIGATFKIPIDENSADLHVGKIVRVKNIETERYNSNSLFFLGELSENQEDLPLNLKKSECLFNLMQGLGEESEEEENFEVVETARVMSHEELMELIFILRRRAFSEEEYMKAYNYLGLVLVLCHLAEDEALAEDVKLHMQLIVYLQEFGRNEKLNIEVLEELESRKNLTTMLERLLTRLKIVANLDINEKSEWLLHCIQEPNNEMEKELASLVLSHNMLPSQLESSRKEIKNEIATRLKVNNMSITSKYYGEESQTIEFKSSLIFKAGRPEAGGGFNPEGQLLEITQSVCAFMNARGGRIYIGVNKWGYETGLNDDLTEMKRRNNLNTYEDLRLYLQNHLYKVLPLHAKNKVRVNPDEQSKKGVIMVEIDPVEEPVEINGIIHLRLGSTKRDLYEEEAKKEFIKQRPQEYQLMMAKMGVIIPEKYPDTEIKTEESSPLEENIEKGHENLSPNNLIKENGKDEGVKEIMISTGNHRPNILHHWDDEDHFVNPAMYIYFKTGNRLFCADYDMNDDYDTDCGLGLAILDREMQGKLIIGFSDGRVLKLPIETLYNLYKNQETRLAEQGEIVSVNISNEDDYLLSVVQNTQGLVYYRIDSVSKIKESKDVDENATPLSSHSFRIINQDIVEPGKLTFFNKEAVNKGNKIIGVSMPYEDNNLSLEQKIERFLTPIAHSF